MEVAHEQQAARFPRQVRQPRTRLHEHHQQESQGQEAGAYEPTGEDAQGQGEA